MSTDNIVRQFLSNLEYLVYKYIKERVEEGEELIEPMSSIARKIKDLYEDEIPLRKNSKTGDMEKTFSDVTVHRAIKKLVNKGIMSIKPSKEKNNANPIIFHGLLDEKSEMDSMTDFVNQLNINVGRFKKFLDNKNQQIIQLNQEKELLYEEIENIQRKNKDLKNKIGQLQFIIKEQNSQSELIQKGEIISSSELGEGRFALIIKK
jgi:predicted nucleotidyltransferase